MPSMPWSTPDPPTVRVLCGVCRKKLTDFDSEPLTIEDLTRMIDRGKVTMAPRRTRHNGARYPCSRCGHPHVVRLDRLRRAYWRAVRGRTERPNVIVLPHDL